ncbi:MAG: hypothetical protein ACRCS8_01320 [Brevinema sp.]
MLIELGQNLLEGYVFPNKDVEALVMMVVVPTLVLLRGCAIIGIIFPIFRALYNMFFEQRTRWGFLLATLIWIILNIYILNTDVESIWKWLWIDYTGIIIFIYTISFFITKQIQQNQKIEDKITRS